MSSLLNIRCPSCQSKLLNTIEKSGSKLMLNCLACGYTFNAVDTDEVPQKIVQQSASPADAVNNTSAPADLQHLNRRILEIAVSEGKLNAIKYCTEQTGWGLERSREHVDRLTVGNNGVLTDVATVTAYSPLPDVNPFDQELVDMARSRGKLHAVKHYKDVTGKGLKESLAYVDRLVPREAFRKPEGCFIATACYGDYNAPEVKVLRTYRDEHLLKTKTGKALVQCYYLFSPALANAIKDADRLKKLIRNYILAPLVRYLQ